MDKTKPLLLLDRDGTLITEQDYLKDPAKIRFLSGVIPALRRLSKAGFTMAVISNQSGVGRGLMTLPDLRRVNQRFQSMLRARGVRLIGIYFCPHHPDKRCACRKPKLALVKRASRDLGVSYNGSISVGDKWIDVALGQKTKGKGILVLTGYGRRTLADKTPHPKPDFIASRFSSAATWILKTTQRSARHV